MITDSHFHGFASKLHILQKSDFFVHWKFAYRGCDKHGKGSIYEKLRKLCNIVWCRFNTWLQWIGQRQLQDEARDLTHWGRATHICVSKLTIIASDNGLSPGRRQAIIWNNAGILSIGLLGTKFRAILIEIQTFSFKKMHLKMSSAKWRPFVSASMC